MRRHEALIFGQNAYAKGIECDPTKDEEFMKTLEKGIDLQNEVFSANPNRVDRKVDEKALMHNAWKKGWDNGKILDELGF